MPVRDCYEDSNANKFFNPMSIQLMDRIPAIKSLLLAISAMHRNVREQGEEAANADIFFLKQYSTALALASSMDDISVVLVACLLLAVLESLRRNHDGFLYHLRSGVSVLRQHDQENKLSRTSPAFDRLETFVRPTLLNLHDNAPVIIQYRLLDPEPPSPAILEALSKAAQAQAQAMDQKALGAEDS